VLLPIGTWIAVTAQEHDLVGVTTLPLASIAFIKIEDQAATELLWVTFSRREPPPSPTVGVNSTPQWPVATGCQSGQQDAWHRLIDADMRTSWCAMVRTLDATAEPYAVSNQLRTELSAWLSSASLRLGPFRVQSEYHVTNRAGSFISYVHLQGRLLSPTLLELDLSAADVSIPSGASAELRQAVLQLAHFAYHASMAFQRQYPELTLREEAPANSAAVQRDLGRLP
jgi:hypothetical protein